MTQHFKILSNDILEIAYEFLLIHKQVALPKIGNFRLQVMPRKYNFHYYVFEPKKYQIVYDNFITTKDVELFKFVASKYKTDVDVITFLWDDFIQHFMRELKSTKEKFWFNLGYFYLSTNDYSKQKILFQAKEPQPILNHFNITFTPLSIVKETSPTIKTEEKEKEKEHLISESNMPNVQVMENNIAEEKSYVLAPVAEEEEKSVDLGADSSKKYNLHDEIDTVLFYDDSTEQMPSIEIEETLREDESSDEANQSLNFSNLNFQATSSSDTDEKNTTELETNHVKNQKDIPSTTYSKSGIYSIKENNVTEETFKRHNLKPVKKYKNVVLFYIIGAILIAYLLFHFFLYNYSLDTIYNK